MTARTILIADDHPLFRQALKLAVGRAAPDATILEAGQLGEAIEAAGLKFTGLSPDGVLPEICEREDHPWFIGVQFHPELKSRPFAPHPLFASFVGAAKVQSRLV